MDLIKLKVPAHHAQTKLPTWPEKSGEGETETNSNNQAPKHASFNLHKRFSNSHKESNT